jgi:hypothetical protein
MGALAAVAALVLVVAGLMIWTASGRNLTLTASDIQSQLDRQFPMEKDYLLAKVVFSEPAVTIPAGGSRVELGVTVSATAFGSRPVTGRVRVDGGVRYDPGAGALYLTDTKAEVSEMRGVSRELRGAVEVAVREGLTVVLNSEPIYRLKDDRRGEALARRVVREVAVEESRVIIRLGP